MQWLVMADMTPEQAYSSCVRSCVWGGSTQPAGYSSLRPTIGLEDWTLGALCLGMNSVPGGRPVVR